MPVLHILLFLIYFAAAVFAILRIPFFRKAGVRPVALVLLFVLRVFTGCLHNWIAWRYYPGHGDIWTIFHDSFVSRDELYTDFHLFLQDNSTLAYLPHNAISFVHLLLNYLSFDNLYINTLLFSLLAFWGNTALFRVFMSWFPGSMLSAMAVFLIPSTLFWTSCIHVDGICYLLIGLLLFYLQRRKIVAVLFILLLILVFRSLLVAVLLPALVCWIWGDLISPVAAKNGDSVGPAGNAKAAHRFKQWGQTVLILVLATALFWPGSFDHILGFIGSRQQEYFKLVGDSRIFLPALEPSIQSFMRLLPTAMGNGLFQPLPGQGGKALYLAFALELVFVWALFVWALVLIARQYFSSGPEGSYWDAFLNSPERQATRAYSLGCLIFALLGMLMIGCIVPFIGAIVRYRAIYLPFLLAPVFYSLRGIPFIRRIDERIRKAAFR